jgi:hypothetical protein
MSDRHNEIKSEIDKTRVARSFVQYKREGDHDFTTIGAVSELPHYEWYEKIEIIRQSTYKELAEDVRIDKHTTKCFFRKPIR